jgi:hypothetical protein
MGLFSGCGVLNETNSPPNVLIPTYKITGLIRFQSNQALTMVGAYKGGNIYSALGDLKILTPDKYFNVATPVNHYEVNYQLTVPVGEYKIIAYQDIATPNGIGTGDRMGQTVGFITVDGSLTTQTAVTLDMELLP